MSVRTLDTWLDDPTCADFPYDAVVDEYLRVGKHFVADDILKRLESVRVAIGPPAPGVCAEVSLLGRFLDTALDKRDGSYDYTSYIALDMLALPTVDEAPEPPAEALLRRDRLVVHLAADLLDFELAVVDGVTVLLPELRPDPGLSVKRCKLAMRVVAPALARSDVYPEFQTDDPVAAARQFCALAAADRSPYEQRMLKLSMLPVYIAHDEYLFIRVLQTFETTFAMLAGQLRAAVEAGARGDVPAAVSSLAAAELALRESAPAFSLLATMQIESFRTFREYTDGASAIQSRNYKVVESLCRKPDAPRLDSLAYLSVPEVRERVLSGQVTLDEVFASKAVAGDGQDTLAAAMRSFSNTLLRWRQTHYSLAVRMLGERSGTGATEGTPYLNAVRTVPVFTCLDSPAAERSTGCGYAND